MGRKKRTRIRNVYDLFVCRQETCCVSGSSTQLELGWSCAFSHVITDDDVLFLGKTTLFHITLWKEVVLRQVQTSFLVSVLGLFCVGVCVRAAPSPFFLSCIKYQPKRAQDTFLAAEKNPRICSVRFCINTFLHSLQKRSNKKRELLS